MSCPPEHLVFLKKRFHWNQVDHWLPPVEMDDAETAKTIDKYGAWMEALIVGTLQPITENQCRFVLAAWGLADVESPFEQAWEQYRLACRTRTQKIIALVNGGKFEYERLEKILSANRVLGLTDEDRAAIARQMGGHKVFVPSESIVYSTTDGQ